MSSKNPHADSLHMKDGISSLRIFEACTRSATFSLMRAAVKSSQLTLPPSGYS